jgi:hypothetical protein
MSVSLLIEQATQFRCVDEVAIVRQADAVGAVDVEWLSFSAGTSSCCRVPKVAYAHGSGKVLDTGTIAEHPGGHSIPLGLKYAATSGTSSYATSILATVLEEVESLVEINGCLARNVGIVTNMA